MSENYDEGMFGGSGLTLIVLILFFLTMNGGFGGFGNAATQGALTRSDLYEGLNSQNTFSEFRSLQNEVTNGFANQALAINNGFAGVQAAIADQTYRMQDCCCQLKTKVSEEAAATRQLIQDNTIQSLRDALQDAKNENLATGLVTANTIQTQNLENFMRTLVNGSCCGC